MIINLTQHPATPEQVAAGVFDLPESMRAQLCALLTFDSLPDAQEIADRAEDIALLADSVAEEATGQRAMIGGAPFLMAALESALHEQRIQPIYAFSKRESAEQTQPDGSVRKINTFRHAGFVEAGR